MHAKGKGAGVPSDAQAREKLALYVYEYLLHIGAQKSAQTFLSEIRWESNITLGEPPGFLHSWWCVFWDLYCAAPDRREVSESSADTKPFHDYQTSTAAPSPIMLTMPPGEGMSVGLVPSGFFQGPPASQMSPHAQPLPHNPSATMIGPHNQAFMSARFSGGLRPSLRLPSQGSGAVPAPHPLLPNAMDPTARPQGHPSIGPIQRMTPPQGMTGTAPQNYGGALRPHPGSLAGPGMLPLNIAPGVRGPWPSMNTNSVTYGSSSPSSYGTPPGGGGPPSTPLMSSPGDSTNSSDNMYLMNPTVPPASRASFSLGPSPEGPMTGISVMEPHHMNGSLGAGDMDGIPKNSPGSMAGGITVPPGTPCEDGELDSSFLNPFQSDCTRSCVERRPRRGRGSRGARGTRGGRGALWQGRTGSLMPAMDNAVSGWKQHQLSEV